MLTWQVLIPTIPHRSETLLLLLAELDRQAQPGFGALLYSDNLQAKLPAKRQALLEAATAEYVSFIDDDDMVSSLFVPAGMAAISLRPDYVGFVVEYSDDGAAQNRAEHSLRYNAWHDWPEHYVRDITHLNPMRRELALLGRYDAEDGPGEDRRWADQIRATGRVNSEEYVGSLMYRYQFHKLDNRLTARKPMRQPLPKIPEYPWLEVMKTPLEVK